MSESFESKARSESSGKAIANHLNTGESGQKESRGSFWSATSFLLFVCLVSIALGQLLVYFGLNKGDLVQAIQDFYGYLPQEPVLSIVAVCYALVCVSLVLFIQTKLKHELSRKAKALLGVILSIPLLIYFMRPIVFSLSMNVSYAVFVAAALAIAIVRGVECIKNDVLPDERKKRFAQYSFELFTIASLVMAVSSLESALVMQV